MSLEIVKEGGKKSTLTILKKQFLKKRFAFTGSYEQCGILGPVFREIIGETFSRLKFGDRYFYELGREVDRHRFSLTELDEIRKVSFARILCDNSPVTRIQPNAFLTPSNVAQNRRVVDCSNIPSMDLSLFEGISGK